MNNSGLGPTLVTEKLTYFRKKKWGRKKRGSSSACMHSEISGSSQQAGDDSVGQKMPGSMPELTESRISNDDLQTSPECNAECLPSSMSVQESNASRLPDATCVVARKKTRRLVKVRDIENKVSVPLGNAETLTSLEENCSHHDDSKNAVKEVFTKDVMGKMKDLTALEKVPNETEKAADNNKLDLNSQQAPGGNDVSHRKYILFTSHVYGISTCM